MKVPYNLVAGSLALSTFVPGTGSSVASTTQPPDVIVILVDDMGFSDLGCYGGEARTPNIDALAENGIRFRHFYNTARCSPTRISILTGLYSHRAAHDPDHRLPSLRTDNNATLAELLRAHGYRTYMGGKWHLGPGEGRRPVDRGFQHAFGFGPQASANSADYWLASDHTLISEGEAISERVYSPEPYGFYQTDALADYSIDFINHHIAQDDDAPFFLYLAPRAPHWHLAARRETAEYTPPGGMSYVDIYAQGWDVVRRRRFERMREIGVIDDRFVLPPFGDVPARRPTVAPVPTWDTLDADRQADLACRMAIYIAMVEHIDEAVGRIVEHLRETGRLDNTLILFLSDNGACAEGGVFGGSAFGQDPLTDERLLDMGQPFANDRLRVGGGWANVSSAPFRLYKRYNHEGGINTPLVAHWPIGIRNPGRWSDQMGHVIDVVPTVLELIGASYPDVFEGRSLLPVDGASLVPVFNDEPAFERRLGFEHETNRAWIDGRWKMVTQNFDSSDGRFRAHEPELYDLALDPSEMNNLAAQHPERLSAMIDAWNAWALDIGRSPSVLLPGGRRDLSEHASIASPMALGANAFAVVDDFSREDGWQLVGGAGEIGVRYVPPTVGTTYFCFSINPGQNSPFANRAVVKDFGMVLEAGRTYTVMLDVNQAERGRAFIGEPFTGVFSDRVAFGFFDSEGFDFSDNSNMVRSNIRDAIHALLLAGSSLPVWHQHALPRDGQWQTWSYSFTVDDDHPYAGRRVWFGVYGGHTEPGTQRSMAADHLRIHVGARPEDG